MDTVVPPQLILRSGYPSPGIDFWERFALQRLDYVLRETVDIRDLGHLVGRNRVGLFGSRQVLVLPQGKGPLRQGVPRLERSWNGVCQGRPKVALRSPQGQIKVPAYGGLGYSSRTVSPNASSLVTCY